jgi:hypothetical protein
MKDEIGNLQLSTLGDILRNESLKARPLSAAAKESNGTISLLRNCPPGFMVKVIRII